MQIFLSSSRWTASGKGMGARGHPWEGIKAARGGGPNAF